jgi:hypothetical protein
MLKSLAIGFGIVFIILGILGFILAAAPNNLFLGIFPVDGPYSVVGLIEDSISLVAGIVGLWCGRKGASAAKGYFQILGAIFLLLTVLGVSYGDKDVFGFIPNSQEDMWFNCVFAVLFISIGIGLKAKTRNREKSGISSADSMRIF